MVTKSHECDHHGQNMVPDSQNCSRNDDFDTHYDRNVDYDTRYAHIYDQDNYQDHPTDDFDTHYDQNMVPKSHNFVRNDDFDTHYDQNIVFDTHYDDLYPI